MLGRIYFMGIPIDRVRWPEAIHLAAEAMRKRRRLQIGDVNVSKLIDMQHDPELLRCTEESDLVCIDGMGVLWACQLLGAPAGDRIAGIDLMSRVIEICEREGFRPYFLGASETVVSDLVKKLRKMYPELKVAGWRNGYFDPKDEATIVAEIRASSPDCLFVGISSPIKERFLNRHRDALGAPLLMGVGGSFDVFSGHIRRAPPFLQKIGLEWLFRLTQEPRRLSRRYFVSNFAFLKLLLRTISSGDRGTHMRS